MRRLPSPAACLVLLLLFQPVNVPAQDLLVHGGTVVTSEGSFEADVLVQAGVITALGQDLSAGQDVRHLDASGLLILPGGVDPHVHVGGRYADDYHTGSMAAVAGGITTISNFRNAVPGADLTELIEREAALIDEQSIADVILHTIITDPATQTSQLQALVDGGQPSIKIFMHSDFFESNAASFLKAIEAAGNAGILTMVHAEDASILAHQASELEARGQTSLAYFADARPSLAEETAMKRAVAMAEQSGSPIYAVHVSSERGLRVAQEARERGLQFFIETRPIYLHLTRERYDGSDPGIYTGAPPLREQADQDALWEGLANGTIQTIGTDHAPYSREDKLDPNQTITNLRAGMNHLQMLRPLLYSEGVLKDRITIERLVELTATNPAKLFGIFPRKGTIAVGSDADLVLWDPAQTRTVRDQDMFSAAGFSIYTGWEVTGWPLVTVRRGEVVYEDGEIRGQAGSGLLLERERWVAP